MSTRVPDGTRRPTFSAMTMRGLADQGGIWQALRRDQCLGEQVGFVRRQEVPAMRLELPDDFLGDGLVDDHRIGRRAQHAVVEALAQEDVLGGLGEIGGRLDVTRGVARSDAIGGLARAVGCTHQPHAAGGEDHGDLALLHQFLGAFEGHRRQPADGALQARQPAWPPRP